MTLIIELEHHHLTRPGITQTGNPEKDYYLDIIHNLETKAYDQLSTRKRNASGKLGDTKGNRWKQSSAEFCNSLASQGKDWINGSSSYPNPYSFKQWCKIRSILKDRELLPYQDKIDIEKHTRMMEELKRKASAYDALTNGNSSPEICTDTVKNPDWNMVYDLDEDFI
jgi:hypothetical protein